MEDKKQLVLFIIVGTFVLMFLIMALIIFVLTYQRKIYKNKALLDEIEKARQLELFKAASRAEELEKERISRNLHDEVKPMLILLAQHLEKKEQNKLSAGKASEFEKEYTLIDKLMDSLRTITYELGPTFIQEHGLLKSIHSHMQDLNALGNIQFCINQGATPFPENSFTPGQLLSIYRIFLEILSNLSKHSGCSRVNVLIRVSDHLLHLIFSHDGKGLSNEEVADLLKVSKGLGLKSIKARALLLQGSLDFLRYDEHSEIILTLPILQNPSKNL